MKSTIMIGKNGIRATGIAANLLFQALQKKYEIPPTAESKKANK